MSSVHRIHICLSAILVVVAIGTKVSADSSGPTTKLIQVLFRHGDRTPDFGGNELYPNDPYRNYKFYPMGLGQLTNDGKNREYALGYNLRNKYNDFLGKIITSETVQALSSDYDRTKMSLQLVLAGLFPPASIQRWNRELNWQPIPASYLSRNTDNLFLTDECPLYLQEYNRVLKTPSVLEIIERYRELMQYLTEKTGKNITTMMDFYYLYHTLMAEKSMNLTLPAWTKPLFPYGQLWDATIDGYNIASYNTLLKRLYAGHLLRRITENMKNYENQTLPQGRKVFLYSGHETNIASMLQALGVFKPHVPEYSSAIIFNLMQQRNNLYVKVSYYTGIPPLIEDLQLPRCDVLCPLEKFLYLTADVIPSDNDLICVRSG